MATDGPTQASTTSSEASGALPKEVVTCLQNARFLHLATASDNTPHISLMNYTYLPSTPYAPHPTIIMTTPPSSRKTLNLASNPRVSLLVHDWVSHRPPTLAQPGRSPSPTRPGPRSGSLAELLLGMNTASLSRISTTINGDAELVDASSEQEAWYKQQHLENNTFGPSEDSYSSSPVGSRGLWAGLGEGGERADQQVQEGDGGTKSYCEGEDVRVVVVRIRDGRIADWKGNVRDWAVGSAREASLVNGV
ncbi:pyridoxamine phosphate oxidase-like protein [Polyplosphaeria fusca]|uniref:Pyridoxamine phosphate oxidase-like protein n=1 Tax=Polyplosphaeria fusca TaxID=682080 RepID=A0A9P4V3A4_9PLEO|nr:pyridoxamine phosphate oxidase-like protein [Polyplosphaeria fusca]